MSLIHIIINTFSLYLLDFTKLLLVIWGIMNFELIKSKQKLLLIGMGICILLIGAGSLLRHNQGILYCFLTILVISTFIIIFQGKFLKKFTSVLLAYISILFLDVCVTGIISIPGNFTLLKISNNDFVRFICDFISIILLGIILLILKLKKKKNYNYGISKKIYAFLFIGAGTGTLLVGSLMVSALPVATDRFRRTMLIVTIITCVTYCIVCLLLIIISESRDSFKALSLINQEVIESQQRYYTLVKEKQQEIRGIRHDMINHLTCIDSLYKRNKRKDMEEYISKLIYNTDARNDFFETGNDIVDAILNDVSSRYKKEDIEITLEGAFPPELYINPMDLCVVFANAVNNAVEAVLKIGIDQKEKRYININIRSNKEDLYIDIKNPVYDRVRLSGGNPVTTKQNKIEHGFGTKNMRQVVEKYQGSLQFHSEDHIFLVEIQMQNRIIC